MRVRKIRDICEKPALYRALKKYHEHKKVQIPDFRNKIRLHAHYLR